MVGCSPKGYAPPFPQMPALKAACRENDFLHCSYWNADNSEEVLKLFPHVSWVRYNLRSYNENSKSNFNVTKISYIFRRNLSVYQKLFTSYEIDMRPLKHGCRILLEKICIPNFWIPLQFFANKWRLDFNWPSVALVAYKDLMLVMLKSP